MTRDPEWVDSLKRDWRSSRLTERQRALLEYAVKLTLEPWAMTAADLDPMRAAGLTDADILAANQVTGYYAYVNRLADGLGVELEAYADGE